MEQSTGLMGRLTTVSASIFHDTNALHPVQCVEIQPLLPAGSSEKPVENETKFFLEILLENMAATVTKVHKIAHQFDLEVMVFFFFFPLVVLGSLT